ncbi:MAG: S41 family peptidase [Thermoflexales bacterium]|nr:S41 family peptidase [Thermoflexales bacterium]MDW8352163.1 S41 family peptidase [Anaerolineae bacterium]
MSRTEKALAVVAFCLWSAMMVGVGYVARMLTAPVELRIERIYSSGGHALLDEAWGHVRNHFVGSVPSDTLRNYGAVRGALATLNDRYTTFVEPQPRALERDHIRGSFGGIGVNFARNERGEIVLSPMPDGPAAKAGVREGDILISIDGAPLPSPAALEDVARIRGEVGTPVTIEVLRGPQRERLKFTIVRQMIEVKSVEWRPITSTVRGAAATIGYVRIIHFTERTGEEVRRALAALAAADSQAYLIDLRDNGGGLLAAAVDVASEFLREGVVAIEQRRNHPDIVHRVITGRPKPAGDKPVAILVNSNTASAAEIVAGAIQDHKRGLLIGTKTFGKGSVQLVFDLSDGSAVRLTAARWLTPQRRELDGIGLTPDVEVSGSAEEQLDRAIAELGEAMRRAQ